MKQVESGTLNVVHKLSHVDDSLQASLDQLMKRAPDLYQSVIFDIRFGKATTSSVGDDLRAEDISQFLKIEKPYPKSIIFKGEQYTLPDDYFVGTAIYENGDSAVCLESQRSGVVIATIRHINIKIRMQCYANLHIFRKSFLGI